MLSQCVDDQCDIPNNGKFMCKKAFILSFYRLKKRIERKKGGGGREINSISQLLPLKSSSYLNELTDPGADRTTAAAWIYNA